MRPVHATKLKKPPSDKCLAQYEAMLTPPQKFKILTSKFYQRLSSTKYVNLTHNAGESQTSGHSRDVGKYLGGNLIAHIVNQMIKSYTSITISILVICCTTQ